MILSTVILVAIIVVLGPAISVRVLKQTRLAHLPVRPATR